MLQSLKCPNCGAPTDGLGGQCAFCHSAFILKRLTDFEGKSAQLLAKYEQQYKSVEPRDPHYIECQVALIRIYLERKLLSPADGLSKKCLEDNPDHGELYICRAAVLMEKSRVKQMSLGAARDAAQLLATGAQLGADSDGVISLGRRLADEYYRQNGIMLPETLRQLLDVTISARAESTMS